ncbi:MAG: MG2 domain-containing protein, partial [Planctomycetota bacterium]|nr:MG2 domain-containing protein [Planctomycetota bacterium]
MRRLAIVFGAVGVAVCAWMASADDPEETFKRAEEAFKKHNYKDAALAYEAVLKVAPEFREKEKVRFRIVVCWGKMQEWDKAQKAAAEYADKQKGTVWEPRFRHLMGAMRLDMPKWGYRKGEETVRGGPWREGWEYTSFEAEDRKVAIECLETARELYLGFLKTPPAGARAEDAEDLRRDAVSCNFDLARAIAGTGWQWGRFRQRMAVPQAVEGSGAAAGTAGQPAATVVPDKYSKDLSDKQKVLFLLEEVVRLDTSNKKELAALAVYRKAMFLRPQWLPGTPADEDPLNILREVQSKYPGNFLADAAQYGIGLILKDRNDLPGAEREFRQLLAQYPKSEYRESAEYHLDEIARKELNLSAPLAQLPGRKVILDMHSRNLDAVRLSAFRVKLEDVIADIKPFAEHGGWDSYSQAFWHNDRFHRFRGEKVAEWDFKTSDKKDRRPVADKVETPLDSIGAYLVEAAGGGVTARTLVVISDIAVVKKAAGSEFRFYVADAATGKPIERAEVTVGEFWWEGNGRRYQATKITTGELGLCSFRSGGDRRSGRNIQAFVNINGRYATTDDGWWGWYGDGEGRHYKVYSYTDRPVYRPGQTVNFKHMVRLYEGGEYRNVPVGQMIKVTVTDPKGNKIYERTLRLGEFGTADDKLILGQEPPLGMYRMHVEVPGSNIPVAGSPGQHFRVEEYKKPEFEVTVLPSATQARLGEKVTARIQAKYYFGAPVAEGKATYRVFREPYRHVYQPAGPYDWLYGRGYGKAYYWDWEGRWWWGGGRAQPARELVLEGEKALDKDGTVAIEFETAEIAKRFPDQDQQYLIEATVVDLSRRNITGSGTVKVTRSQFYAFVDAKNGFYRPGDKIEFEIRTLNPDEAPVSARGKVKVSKILGAGSGDGKVEEKPLYSRDLATDADGRAFFAHTADEDGQFKVAFETEDAWGKKVEGWTAVWVASDNFDGARYRYRDVEIITDRRSYSEGDTARVMVNSNYAGAWVLLTQEAGNLLLDARVLHLPRKTTLLDIPIKKEHVPNFYLCAAAIRDGKLFVENREMFVPPSKNFMNVAVEADKQVYKPGEKGTLTIRATDNEGRPVQAEVSLSLFDSSVLYFQSDLAPDIRQYFYGRRRHLGVRLVSSLQSGYGSTAHDGNPRRQYKNVRWAPPNWNGWGSGRWDEADKLEEALQETGIGGGQFGAREGGARLRRAADAAGNALPAAAERAGAPMESAKAAAPGMDRDGAEAEAKDKLETRKKGDGPGEALAMPDIRSNFADQAHWAPTVVTGPDGRATIEVVFPDNLTTWRASAVGLTKTTQVGSAKIGVVTTKNLIVRLQAPRFFVERDEVVLSANVHNYLKSAKRAKCELTIPPDILGCSAPMSVDVEVPAGGEKRLDWRVKVLREGQPTIAVKALTDEESDAMKLSFPAFVHGTEKFVASNGAYRPQESGSRGVPIELPADIKPEATELRVTLSPSIAGAMLDALPYLLDYPYGCTEQTMSRFLPAVLVQKTLRDTGLNLEDLRNRRGKLPDAEAAQKRGYWHSPVFDSSRMADIINAGLNRLYGFQNADGSWGWWRGDSGNPSMTAYVLYGLKIARDAGVTGVDENRRQRGLKFLEGEMASLVAAEKDPDRAKFYNREQAAYAAYVLALDRRKNDAALNLLWNKRDNLNIYGKSLLALTFQELGDREKAKIAVENIMQWKKEDKDAGTMWFENPQSGRWWSWYWDDIETNAWALRAVAAVDPKSEDSYRLVKWLLNNRKGLRWRSTKDTANVIYALSSFMRSTDELNPEYTVTVDFEGVKKKVNVTKDNMWGFDNSFVLKGSDIPTGARTVRISKDGPGALYYNVSLKYFTKEQDIKGAGNEIWITRSYYRCKPKTATVKSKDASGREIEEKRLEWEKTPLKMGEVVTSGEEIEVELKIKAGNDYEYMVFEDMKPAGCEPVDLKSGTRYGDGLCSNMELRDAKVAFFVTFLRRGEHTLRYRLRAEIPG